MEPSLLDMFQDKGKRTDLFNLWMHAAGNFGQVALKLKKENVQSSAAGVKVVEWSRAQIEQSGLYAPEDVDGFIEKATKEGRYSEDPNFPGVEKYRKYTFVQEVSKKEKQESRSSRSLEVTGNITHGEAAHMTAEGDPHPHHIKIKDLNVKF